MAASILSSHADLKDLIIHEMSYVQNRNCFGIINIKYNHKILCLSACRDYPVRLFSLHN